MADYSNDFRLEYAEGACRISFRCFDTPNSVAVYGVESYRPATEDLLLEIRRLCLELHWLWSFSLPGSDLRRINGDETSVQVDARTADLVRRMQGLHEVEPRFDFTVGPLSFFWKQATGVPAQAEVERAMRLVGADKVWLDGDCVCKESPGVQVDIGAVAKGYVADLIAVVLRERDVQSADIDLGGNLYMVGAHPSGRPWRVSVYVPDGMSADPQVLEVEDASVVTSGTYERFVEIGGKRYQHVIDPRTGWPSDSDFVSATVVSRSSSLADALATALLITGSAGFDDFAARHRDCRLVAITQEGRVLQSPG